MNGSTKILTVSYGTFSCTLEGFEDPLGTMRELAEYFRDLAADDRYFGAEPPTPDVEMLQNIAQRDVNRQVEARTSATGVALTQVAKTEETVQPVAERAPVVEDAQESATPETHPQSAPDNDTGPLTFDDDFLMADEPEDVLAIDPDAAVIAEGPAETVAEKLRRIRAVVSRRPGELNNATNSAQAAAAETKRDRAMSETIRQIQDDLADDDAAQGFEDEDQDLQPFEAQSEDRPVPKAEAAPEMEAASEIDNEAAPDALEISQEADLEEDTLEGDDSGRTVSQFLENVSEKIGDTTAENSKPSDAKPLGDGKTDADVGRLLEETDSKLNEDGVVRRRQVISQMRAAVAATKADRAVTRLISPEVQDEVEKSAYRNDLSDAVEKAAPLPDQSRKVSGPPLVLVSSQRVSNSDSTPQEYDEDDTAEEIAETQPARREGFAKFVEVNDAKGLEELLEAAAAYTIFSKGQESFSRPEIMKRVAMVDPALSLSREDGLRSFGQLLRQGKFQKLDRGQFTIDHDTRFNPDKRIAGE